MMIIYRPERARHERAIQRLVAESFPPVPGGWVAENLRRGLEPEPGLSLVATRGGEVVGTVRFWPMTIMGDGGGTWPALLLGPLAVAPAARRQGVGRELVARSLDRAARRGYARVVLIGAPAYYQPLGFVRAADHAIALPEGVEAERLMVRSLRPDALQGVRGTLLPGRCVRGGAGDVSPGRYSAAS
ncbi:MAG: N-acetyltransferase [Alphaproteobacteria bacterium]|nr:N-acetyltransferase [Alphaproteobacteria bacterium]